MGKKKQNTTTAAPVIAATTPAPVVAAPAPAPEPTKPPVKRVPALEVPRITRMEEEERKIISEALYQSELDKLHQRDDQLTFVSQTNAEKLKGFKSFAGMMADPVNRRVMRVFVFVTILMFSVPIVSLFIGMRVLAPVLGMEKDRDTVGGLFAVATTVVIMVGYVVFALGEDEVFDERVQEANIAANKEATAAKKKAVVSPIVTSAVPSSKSKSKKQ
ncbi:membrane-associated protein, putative [Bodo saltans]|uniref:Membrane-associated protein, putative n=1 Tax=Bodo saltans TaxID=75058 RepID=A0A0S4KKT5_BODSA|nr:membrane-associated protein, putative [Bodo saltans]|eukprot:CUI14244.1 membrane-associated protein, putative [Bodo saltans]